MKKLTSALFIIFIIFSAKAFAADNEIIKRITEGEESAKITIIAYAPEEIYVPKPLELRAAVLPALVYSCIVLVVGAFT